MSQVRIALLILTCGFASPFIVLADIPVPIEACNADIQLSDSAFLQKIAGNPDQAKQIAANLTLCVQNNMCASSSMDGCTTLLSNRLFLSIYYGSANIAPPAANTMSFNVPTSPTSSLAHATAQPSPYTIGTIPDVDAKSNSSTPPNTSAPANTGNQDIHWF